MSRIDLAGLTFDVNPAADNASEQFGPYDVYERLGIGGMAMVHRAKKRGPQGFEQTVALKRMLAHLAEDPTFVESFVREAKVASLLVHPNIAQVYDFGRIRGIYYIAMELVAGFDVRKLLRYANRSNEPIPLPVIISLLGELCDALDHAHNFIDDTGTRLDIVHRDVSPSNMIVAYTGHLKVIDFGIAKAQARQLHTESGKVKGKLGYMSPEAALGISSGPVSDMFSMGVVAWELVTASPLFTTRTDMETMQRIREATIAPPSYHNPTCPPELDQLILAALEREPTARLSSAASFRAGLDDIAARAGIQISARSVVEWISRFAQPNDGWARASQPVRDKPPTGRNSPPAVDPTSVIRKSTQRSSESQRPRTPSRPPQLRRSAEHVALAMEIWGEDQQTVAPEPGPDFSIANVRAATPMPNTRVLGPPDEGSPSSRMSSPTVPPPMRGSTRNEEVPTTPSHRALSKSAPPPMRGEASTVPPPMRGTPTTSSIVSLPNAHDARVTNLPLRANRPSTPSRTSSAPPGALPDPATPHSPSGPYGVPNLPPLLVPAAEYTAAAPPRRSKTPLIVLGALAVIAGVLVAILLSRSSEPTQVAAGSGSSEPTAAGSGSAAGPKVPAPDAAENGSAVGVASPGSGSASDEIEISPDAPGSAITRPTRPTRPTTKPTKPTPRVDTKPETPDKPDPEPTKPEPNKPEKPEPTPPVTKPDPPVTSPTTPAKPARTPVVAGNAVTKLSGEIPAVRATADGNADVVVKMCIDEQGRVTSVTSKTSPDILAQLQRGLSSWRYKPFLRDGKPSAVCFPLTLRLVTRG